MITDQSELRRSCLLMVLVFAAILGVGVWLNH